VGPRAGLSSSRPFAIPTKLPRLYVSSSSSSCSSCVISSTVHQSESKILLSALFFVEHIDICCDQEFPAEQQGHGYFSLSGLGSHTHWYRFTIFVNYSLSVVVKALCYKPEGRGFDIR
jgi:hypothetical protein